MQVDEDVYFADNDELAVVLEIAFKLKSGLNILVVVVG